MVPGVIAKWGKPVSEFWRREVPPEKEARTDRVGEVVVEMNSTPRDPTSREAYAALGNFVYQWREEHPDYEVIYLEVSRSSPQRLRMQFRPLHASPLPPLATIAGWIIYGMIIAFAIAVAVLVLTPVIKVIYEILTGTGAAGTAFKYLVYGGMGLVGLWMFSKAYPAIRGKAKKG